MTAPSVSDRARIVRKIIAEALAARFIADRIADSSQSGLRSDSDRARISVAQAPRTRSTEDGSTPAC
jgi:hypothetical protein